MFTIKSKICPHPLSTHFPSALLRPWFQCSLFKNVAKASNGSRLALIVEAGLVCSLGVKTDDNWNMKICNKKQYLYFICTFEL